MVEIRISKYGVMSVVCQKCGAPTEFYHYLPSFCTICQARLTNAVPLLFGPEEKRLAYHRLGMIAKESRRVPR